MKSVLKLFYNNPMSRESGVRCLHYCASNGPLWPKNEPALSSMGLT